MQPGAQGGMVTPEAVHLRVETADAGSRGTALFIDTLIQFGVFLALGVFLAGAGADLSFISSEAIGLVFEVCAILLYFIFFEALWNGQTPGKRALKLRVLTAEGQPIGMKESIVRNLMRLIDILPTFYLVGLVAIIVSGRNQRLGDMAGGTIVVRENVVRPPAPLVLAPSPPGAPSVDTAAIGSREYEVVRGFLLRRHQLPAAVRAQLATQIATSLRPMVGGGSTFQGPDESFLEEVARSYHKRSGEPAVASAGSIQTGWVPPAPAPPIPPPPAGQTPPPQTAPAPPTSPGRLTEAPTRPDQPRAPE